MLYKIAAPIIQPRMRFFDANGKPLVGGKVYSFKVGTEIFKPTYRDAQRTALNQNPVVLDNEGSALIYLLGSHVLKVYDKKGNFREQIYVPEAQMTTQFFDKFGKPLSFGKVWTYDIASTIKKTSFSNADQSQPNPNPIILDAEGKASISMIGSYRLRTYNEKNVHLGDQDFQRPVSKALTSRPYPLEHDEDLTTYFRLFDFQLRTLLHEHDLEELLKHSVRIGDLILRDTLRTISEEESFDYTFRLSNLILKTTLHSTEANEQLEHVFRVGNMILDDVLITNTMEREAIEHAFRLGTIVRTG